MQSVSTMFYIKNYGHPDLFITTTTINPNWPEIKDNLFMQEPGDQEIWFLETS